MSNLNIAIESNAEDLAAQRPYFMVKASAAVIIGSGLVATSLSLFLNYAPLIGSIGLSMPPLSLIILATIGVMLLIWGVLALNNLPVQEEAYNMRYPTANSVSDYTFNELDVEPLEPRIEDMPWPMFNCLR